MKNIRRVEEVCLIFFALAAISGVRANAIPAPTPPVIADVKPQTGSSGNVISFTCPETISVAPVPEPVGWHSLGNVTRRIQSIRVDIQQRQIVCWYGTSGDTNFFVSSLLGRSYPADYECKVQGPGVFAAICKKRIRTGR